LIKKKFSKKTIGLISAALIFGLLFVYNLYRGDRPHLLVVSTGSPGGVYYPLGGPYRTYDHQDEDIPVIAVNNVLVARADLDDELAYDMTRILFSNRERLIEVHDIARRISLETATETSVEIHPGAARFFKEVEE